MKKVYLVTLIALLLFPLATMAASNIGFNGIGARVGFIMPESDIENAIGFGLNADLGSINETIKLDAYVDYWGKSYDLGYYEWSYSVINIAAIGKYYFPAQGSIKPYAGGGLGFAITSVSGDYTGPSYNYGGYYSSDGLNTSESETDFALHLLGGASMELSPSIDGFAEAKYTIGGIDYFGIWVGFNYKLK